MNFMEDKLSQKNRSTLTETKQAFDVDYCPSCLTPVSESAVECSSCNVIISQFKRVSFEKRLKMTIGGLYHLTSYDCEELEKAWTKVESAFYDTEIHHQFMHMCYKMRSLPFAVKKYSDRLETNPGDDVADVMRRRVMLLAQESLPAAEMKVLPPSLTTASLMRLFTAMLGMGTLSGVLLLFIAAFTSSKMYYFGLGMFLIVSTIMSLLMMRRQLI